MTARPFSSGDDRMPPPSHDSRDTLRLLWEQEPLAIVDRIMTYFLKQNDTDRARLLYPVQQGEGYSQEKNETTSVVFDHFYQGQLPCMYPESQKKKRATTRKHHRLSFRLDLAYHGPSFCGWQRQQQQNKPSVQGTIEDVLEHHLHYTVDVRVAGRTDSGVSAVHQVARVRTAPNVTALQLFQTLQAAAAPDYPWRCHQVKQVDESFHPTFRATCRSYVYLLDGEALETFYRKHHVDILQVVDRLNRMLQQLENEALDYVGLMYGRVKTQSTVCILCHARARQLLLYDNKTTAVAMEFTGNRFLRRMVRILVATALSSVLQDGAWAPDALKQVIHAKDRSLSARAAPAHGLIFVGAEVA